MIAYALTSLPIVKRAMRSALRWNLDASRLTELEAFIESIIDEVSMEVIDRELNYNPKNWEHTEYHCGKFILLDRYPIISISSVQYDPSLEWTSPTTLTANDEYWILDNQSGLIKISFEATVRNSIKVQYRAGHAYAMIQPQTVLPFAEGASEFQAMLTSGFYNAWDFATMVETAMNQVSGITNTYSVSFDYSSQTFTIGGSATDFTIKASGNSIWELLGFSTDVTGRELVSQFPVPTIPPDLISAVTDLVIYRYKFMDRDRLGVVQETRGDQVITYDFTDIPSWSKRVFTNYRKKRIG